VTSPRGRRVHQLVARCEPGDAVSAHALAMRDWFATQTETTVHVERHDDRTVAIARPIEELDCDDDALVVLHASVGGPLLDSFAAAPGRKVLVFHNFTPAHFFAEWDPPTTRVLEHSWAQLRLLAPLVEVACGVSAFNGGLLAGAGFSDPQVLPLVVESVDGTRDPETDDQLTRDRVRGGARWLYVGRISPNKAQHELVRALAVAHAHGDADARLWLVGSDFTPSYTAALRHLSAELGVTDAIDVTGPVSATALRSYYAAADVFVSCSEHEGFGVPLVEAMVAGVPVVARAAAAVPETVGDAGVLLDRSEPHTTALAVDAVLGDAVLRDELVRRGRVRAAAFSRAALHRRLTELFGPLLDAPSPLAG